MVVLWEEASKENIMAIEGRDGRSKRRAANDARLNAVLNNAYPGIASNDALRQVAQRNGANFLATQRAIEAIALKAGLPSISIEIVGRRLREAGIEPLERREARRAALKRRGEQTRKTILSAIERSPNAPDSIIATRTGFSEELVLAIRHGEGMYRTVGQKSRLLGSKYNALLSRSVVKAQLNLLQQRGSEQEREIATRILQRGQGSNVKMAVIGERLGISSLKVGKLETKMLRDLEELVQRK